MKYLSEYMEEAQTKLFAETGSFFAIGTDQFEKQQVPGINYVSMGYGLICPEENADKLSKGLKEIATNAVIQDMADHGAEKIIEREYFNHETQISCDRDAAIAALYHHQQQFPEQFTDQKIHQVMNNCYKLAVENDWF